jgi:dihydrodipicolinate synthase/N-acetylneuraminate lyase
MPAIITPFTAAGEIDEAAHEGNVARLWARGVHGVVIGGSNGEGPYLEPGERGRLAALARRATPDGFVMVGLAAESLRAAGAMTAEATAAGADAVLVMTPTTLVRQRHDLVEGFFSDLADDSPLPVFLYSVPKVTGYELPTDVAIRLAAHPNVAGMKDSGGDPVRAVTVAAAAPGGFWMFAGASAMVAPAIAGGVHGAVTASANYAPALLGEVVAAAGTPAVDVLHEVLVSLSAAVESHGVAGVKHAATRTGLAGGLTRRPLRPLDGAAMAAIDAALTAAGLVS